MGSSENQENPDEVVNNTFHHSSPSSSRHDWKNRIFIPTLLAGLSLTRVLLFIINISYKLVSTLMKKLKV